MTALSFQSSFRYLIQYYACVFYKEQIVSDYYSNRYLYIVWIHNGNVRERERERDRICDIHKM